MTLPATTILETVTAALLVMVSLSIGLMIYLNVMTSEQVAIKVKAHTVLDHLAKETAFRQHFITESMVVDGVQVEKIITPYSTDYPDALLITLVAYNSDKSMKLCEIKEVLYPGFQ